MSLIATSVTLFFYFLAKNETKPHNLANSSNLKTYPQHYPHVGIDNHITSCYTSIITNLPYTLCATSIQCTHIHQTSRKIAERQPFFFSSPSQSCLLISSSFHTFLHNNMDTLTTTEARNFLWLMQQTKETNYYNATTGQTITRAQCQKVLGIVETE